MTCTRAQMKYDPDKCPECGGNPMGTLEELQGMAMLVPYEGSGGGYDYSGETDVWWDTQRSVTDEAGRVTLQCENGHAWWAIKHEGR